MAYHNNPRIITDGLVLCLDAADKKSYPGSGTTWYDRSRYKNHGTLINGPTFSGGNGGSISFDGTDDYVLLNNTITLNDFTATSVCNVNALRDGWAMFFGSSDSDNFISIANYNGGILRIQDVNSRNSDLSYLSYYNLLNKIIFLQVVQSGNTSIWYINGYNIGTSVNDLYGGMEITHMVYYANTSVLGIWSGNYYAASIYNRALSESEILQNYNSMKGRYNL